MKRALTLVALCILFLTGCGSGTTWYGPGVVTGKEARDSLHIVCGQNTCPAFKNHCFYLKIEDEYGNEHEGCVSEHVWNDADIYQKITITKDYN